jgi:tRNA uridine 5-carboxymethylaminomethyl modification enzyme
MVAPLLERAGSSALPEPKRIAEIVRRPGISLRELLEVAGTATDGSDVEELHWVETELKYAGYLERERAGAERLAEMADFRLPPDLDFGEMNSLSREAREKLQARRPATLGDAKAVPGVSPSDLQGLVIEVLRRRGSVSRETPTVGGGG